MRVLLVASAGCPEIVASLRDLQAGMVIKASATAHGSTALAMQYEGPLRRNPVENGVQAGRTSAARALLFLLLTTTTGARP